MKEDVLNPVATVLIRGEAVQVSELTWKDYLRAIREVTDAVMKLLKNGQVVLDRDKIVEFIINQEATLSWVLEAATKKDATFLNKLSAREIIPLIQKVVDLNLNDEVLGPGKALAGRMGDVFGLKKVSLGQSITSSAPATHSGTSTASRSANSDSL
jgi:hypothetical protein